MNIFALATSSYHSFTSWLNNEEDCSNWPAERTKALFRIADDVEESPKICSIKWLKSCWNIVTRSVNTIALMRYGFNLHRLQQVADPHNSLLSKAEFLSFIPIPPLYFSRHPATCEAILKGHRDFAIFSINNGEGTIFQFIFDMFNNKEITPDHIIFTCSPEMTTKYSLSLKHAFSSKKTAKKYNEIHACVEQHLQRWNTISTTKGSVNITNEVLVLACDMMCRLFLGFEDTHGRMASSMNIFYDYIVARFLKREVNEIQLKEARDTFWTVINEAIENEKGLAGELLEDGKFGQKEIGMILFSLLFAGMDSTASSWMYGIYKCAQDAKLQDRVRKEIDQLQQEPENVNKPFYSLACRLPLVKRIMIEGLRMFSPVIGVSRIAKENLIFEVTCENKTVTRHITKGALLFPAQNLMSRCPLLFPDKPEEFIPDRHENSTRLTSLSWRPFGGGLHVCPGSQWYETITAILFAEMIHSYNLSTEIVEEINQMGHHINKLEKPVYVTLDKQ